MKKVYLILLITLVGLIMEIPFASPVKADWTYTVKRGDSLYSIARRVGVTTNALKQRNGLNSNYLRIGQRLTIPTGSGGGSSSGNPIQSTGDNLLLARAIFAEAGAEPYIGQVAVGGVILNRIRSQKFPKTLAGVIYQPHAFESVSNGYINRAPSLESQKAARDSLNGWDPSGGALYFFNPAKTSSPWMWARNIITRIGKHVFAI